MSSVGHSFAERTWCLDFAGENNCVDNMQLHVRLENSGIQAGCLEWCLRFDWHQCCKHHRGSHSSLASTKKAHFPITLSESLWCRFGLYPSGHHLLTWMTSKTFLSDRILTLHGQVDNLWWNAFPLSFERNGFLPSLLYTSSLSH